MFIVQIAGRLGKDPEVRFTPSGQKVTTFTVATNHRKGKEDITIWVRVTVWGERLDRMLAYLKKGSAVVVIGRFNPPSTYIDKEGRTQVTLEVTAEMIEFSPFGRDEQQQQQRPEQTGQMTYSHQDQNAAHDDHYQAAANYGRTPYGAGTLSGQGIASSGSSEDEALPF